MLNALEDDADEQQRWRRLGIGAGIALAFTCVAVYTANTYAPARDLMKRVVRMTVQAPPPEREDKPLPPLPPPPPPKPQAKKAEPKEKAPAPKPEANPTPANPTEVGMDSQSFAEGGGGPGFHVGGNQMGDPNVAAAPAAEPKLAPAPARVARPTKYLMAKPVGMRDVDSLFSKRARQLGLSGLMLIELALDEHGKVRTAKVRKGLESVFDGEVLSAVKNWAFEPPGSLEPGQAVANVRLLRLRFSLATN
jgi:TonB family protein